MSAEVDLGRASPWSAALRYHDTAAAWSCGTPSAEIVHEAEVELGDGVALRPQADATDAVLSRSRHCGKQRPHPRADPRMQGQRPTRTGSTAVSAGARRLSQSRTLSRRGLSRRLTLCHGGSVLIEPGDFAIAIVRRQRLSASCAAQPRRSRGSVRCVAIRTLATLEKSSARRPNNSRRGARASTLDFRLPCARILPAHALMQAS